MKCYSTMALQYHLKSMKWERADKKVTQFGDTAVVIANLDQFVDRIVSALNKKYGCDHCLLLADKISFYHLGITNNLVPMYSKEASYSWKMNSGLYFVRQFQTEKINSRDLIKTESLGPMHSQRYCR